MALEHNSFDVFIVLAFKALQGVIYQVFQCFKFGCSHITFIFQIKLINFVFFFLIWFGHGNTTESSNNFVQQQGINFSSNNCET